MKKNVIYLVALLLMVCGEAKAQRHTDQLGRGLVAAPTGAAGSSTSNLVMWRRLADEYYDVKYNVYKNGTKVASNLTTTCYNDAENAPSGTQYQVAAVVKGVEQAKCAVVTPWDGNAYKPDDSHRYAFGYKDIALATVYDRNGNDVTANYIANDAEVADLDGDGELEIIIKRLNTVDASTALTGKLYPETSTQFVVIDAYDVNWAAGTATLLWRIDCGPNMVSMNSTEIDIIAYDWDEDGKAEVVLRGADNMKMLGADGTTLKYNIGNMSVNTRNTFSTDDSQYAWTHTGAEYLLYLNGATGDLYQQMDYPLKRLESGESSLKTAWGDDYGHRSSKYFFGAPVLDGRHASLFLARGIYTRHKMMAMDLNKGSHQWSERWSWTCNTEGSDWYGQGYHNFIVADVDEDGRDEIVYGSMVIDDNGQGLSTTGYGHGDAQHVGDFNPYRKGLEYFGCLEESPVWGSNYRDATTSEVLYKYTSPAGTGKSGDDGRCLMANLTNQHIGSQGRSVGSEIISSVTNQKVMEKPGESENNKALFWSHLNYRIYWDGDLCSEILDSPGTEGYPAVWDVDNGRIFTGNGGNMNNDSKNNPCFQGDIIGDWREEIIVRNGTDIRVYITAMATDYSMPSLWFDHQYRQAMAWQMMAYNQPPHVSYFLGETEGFTVAPPALTNTGRTEVANGGTINTTTDHLLMAETNDMTVSVTDGAAPYILTVNTPSWVQGSGDNNGITTTTFTHTLTGGAFTGSMRLVKQGDGTLVLPDVTETYTGNTDVWAGALAFSGTLSSSPVWMNRHTKLFGAPTVSSSLTMEYGSAFYPSATGVADASTASYATANISTLNMQEGSRMVFQIDPANGQSDQVNIGTLNLRTRSGEVWESEGPEYLKPVIQIVAKSSLGYGQKFTLGTLDALTIDGAPVSESNVTPVSAVVLEGAGTGKLYFYNGELVLFFEGASWDEDKEFATLYSNDYENAANISDIRSGDYKDCQIEAEANHYLKIRENGRNGGSGTMTFPSYSTNDYQEYVISFKMGFYTSNNKASSFQIKSGATTLATFGWGKWDDAGATVSYTIGSTVQPETLSAVKQTSGTRNSDTNNTITTWYTFTITGSENTGKVTLTVNDGSSDIISNSVISNSYVAVSGFYFTLGSAHAEIGFDDMLLSAYSENEVVPNPSAVITGAYNSNRTVTMNLGTGSKAGTVIKYYTDTELKSDLTTYTGPFVVSSTSTIYYYAESATSAKSEVQSINVTCEPIQLETPVVSGLSLAENGIDNTPTYTFANGDNAGLIGSPSATLTATFNGDAILGFTGTFTPTQNGTLVVTSSADGYTSSQISVDCYVHYAQHWQSADYSTLTEAEMTASYPTWTKSEGGRWASWKDTGSNYTYYSVTDGAEGNAEFTFDTYFKMRRNLSSLVEGYGIGRNITGGETLTVVDATNGDIVALKIYNGYGNSAAAEANYTVYYLRADANVTYGLNNGKLLMQGAIYRPVTSVPVTITAAGWATLYTPYALDFSGVDGLTAYTATCSGNVVTLTPVDNVPANTGVVLKGAEGNYMIPLTASSTTGQGHLKGSATEATAWNTYSGYTLYVLTSVDEGANVQFNRVTSGSIAAGKAFLKVDGGASSAHALNVVFADNLTGISEAKAGFAAKVGKFVEDGKLFIYKRGMKFNANGQLVK